MPKRTIRLIRRRKPAYNSCSCKHPIRCRRRTRGRGMPLPKSYLMTRWMKQKARPWMVRGRGFWDGVWKGFKSVIKPVATIGGPVLDMMAMPEFGVPLSALGTLM